MGSAWNPRVFIVTDADDDEEMIDALATGIADLVARQRGRRATRAAARPRVLELAANDRAPPAMALTQRQVDVLRPLALGLSNKEIARDLSVSPATVKTHVAQLIAILGATNRTDAAIKARERALI